jgi:predicted DsbA family dithiol-disulfide isomerase
VISIEILSDPICPWCFIAKTWFDRALEVSPEQTFQISWKPFQLNPNMPNGGMNRKNYLEKKFGGRNQALEAYRPIVETSVKTKITINFEAIEFTPNTLDAHRLIYWGGIEGVQSRIVSGLFKAYFQDGKDIGDRQVLAQIAGNNGMKSEVINRLLSSDEDKENVQHLDLTARTSGVQGVPMFIIDSTYAISGAQKTEFWKTAFNEIYEKKSVNFNA